MPSQVYSRLSISPSEISIQTALSAVFAKLKQHCIDESDIVLYMPGVISYKLGRLVATARLPQNHVPLKEYTTRIRYYKEDYQEYLDKAQQYLEKTKEYSALIHAHPESPERYMSTFNSYLYNYEESVTEANLHWGYYTHYVQNNIPVDQERFYAEITPLIDEYNTLMVQLATARIDAC